MIRNVRVFAALLGLGAVAACGSASTAERDVRPVASPDYFYGQVSENLTQGADVGARPETLADALPNRVHRMRTAKGATLEFNHSDAVVVGTIISVEPGEGTIYGVRGDDTYEIVAFDDPSAGDRNVLVTMDVTRAVGVEATDGRFTFRVGVVGLADPEEFMASLRGVGDSAVVLHQLSGGGHAGEYVPAMGAALVADVGANGELSFPAFAEEGEFLDGIDTVDELIAEAGVPEVRLPIVDLS